MRARHPSRLRSASPRVWATWCLVGVAWLVGRVPLRMLFPLGICLGRLAYRVAGPRRRITERNLAACFPELDGNRIAALARKVFQAVALGVLEVCVAWLNPKRGLGSRIEVRGAHHFREAVAKGHGVVLLGAHFATLDIISSALADFGCIDVMYRRNKNPVLEWLQVRGRRHYFAGVVERQDTRAVLAALKAGRAVWYAADQDYGAKHSVFAPFFGVEAATITGTARIAAFNGSPVVLLSQHRNYRQRSWTITFSPALKRFPTGDDRADAIRINRLIENEIRKRPHQYLWLHRRFKTRPPGAPPFYAPDDLSSRECSPRRPVRPPGGGQ